MIKVPQQSVQSCFEDEIRMLSSVEKGLYSFLVEAKEQWKHVTESVERRVKQFDELVHKIGNPPESKSLKMESSMEELKCTIQHMQNEIESIKSEQETIRRRSEEIQQEFASVKSFVEEFTLKQREELEEFKNILETNSEHVFKSLERQIQEESEKRGEETKSVENSLEEIQSLLKSNEQNREKDMADIRLHQQEMKSSVEKLKESTNKIDKKLENLEEQGINSKQHANITEQDVLGERAAEPERRVGHKLKKNGKGKKKTRQELTVGNTMHDKLDSDDHSLEQSFSPTQESKGIRHKLMPSFQMGKRAS